MVVTIHRFSKTIEGEILSFIYYIITQPTVTIVIKKIKLSPSVKSQKPHLKL